MRLLHIDSSILSTQSVSRQLTARIIAAWADAHPQSRVEYLDLARHAPGHLSADSLGFRTPPSASDLSEVQQRENAISETLVTQFLTAAGAGLWTGLALAAGWSLRGALPEVIATLDRTATLAMSAIAALLVVRLAWKAWQKRRFRSLSAIPRMSAAELKVAMASDSPPLLLDLRGAGQIEQSGAIRGAVRTEHDRLHEAVRDWPVDRAIVTLCACPEDAGAVQAAKRPIAQGFRSVRPLAGGHEAWRAAGRVDLTAWTAGDADGGRAPPGRATG